MFLFFTQPIFAGILLNANTTLNAIATKAKRVCSLIPKRELKAMTKRRQGDNLNRHHPSSCGWRPTQAVLEETPRSQFFKERPKRSNLQSSRYRRKTMINLRSVTEIQPEESCVFHKRTKEILFCCQRGKFVKTVPSILQTKLKCKPGKQASTYTKQEGRISTLN